MPITPTNEGSNNHRKSKFDTITSADGTRLILLRMNS